jgi:signal transduction histidine kinase
VGFLLLNIEKSTLNLSLSTILCILAAASFQPLNKFLQKTTDKILFRDRYEPGELLYKLATTLAATKTLDDLSQQLLSTLTQRMKISGAAIIAKYDDSLKIIGSEQLLPSAQPHDLEYLKDCHRLTFFEEMAESKLKDFCREYEVMSIVPLKVSSELIGYLVLGHKLSGDVYTLEDESILKIIAPQLAISLQNARHFDQIQQFNLTLKKEVKKATTKLREANTQLKELDKLKDEFISVASHELRTPLTSLRGYLWMSIKESKNLPLKVKNYLDRAFHSSEQVINLTNDILDVSKIEGNKFELIPSEFNLTDLIIEVKDEFANKAKEKHLSLEYIDHQSHFVRADESKIRRVLVNLIGNAIKFTPEKGRIHIYVQEDGQMVVVSVKDTGIGISENNIPKMFKKFGQIDRTLSTSNQEPGTGLGLYICKNIIELSQGKIWVNSELNKGSTFSFTLPKTN